jgi:hypothetical protein
MIFAKKYARFYEKKKIHTWNIRRLVDDSFVPSVWRTRVLYYRLTDFYCLVICGMCRTTQSPSQSAPTILGYQVDLIFF